MSGGTAEDGPFADCIAAIPVDEVLSSGLSGVLVGDVYRELGQVSALSAGQVWFSGVQMSADSEASEEDTDVITVGAPDGRALVFTLSSADSTLDFPVEIHPGGMDRYFQPECFTLDGGCYVATMGMIGRNITMLVYMYSGNSYSQVGVFKTSAPASVSIEDVFMVDYRNDRIEIAAWLDDGRVSM